MPIEVWIDEILQVRVRNESRLLPEELCSITLDAAEIFFKKYGIQEAYHYEALDMLAEALAKTLVPIKIEPLERIDGTLAAWAKRSAEAHDDPHKKPGKGGLLLSEPDLDLMTHEVASVLKKRHIDGFQWSVILSGLKYHLAETYLDFLNAAIDGQMGKKLAKNMRLPKIEPLKRVKTLKSLINNGHKRSPS